MLIARGNHRAQITLFISGSLARPESPSVVADDAGEGIPGRDPRSAG
jgi:hypothetical protein